jgi:hypothetical protein
MRVRAALLLIALSFAPALVMAQVPPPPPPPPPPPVTPDADRCSRETPQFCLNGTSGSVTGLDALRVAATSRRGCSSGDSAKECEHRRSGGAVGLRAPVKVAAASGASQLLADAESSPWGVWGSYGKSKFRGSVPVAPYKGDMDSFRFGADRALSDKYVIGAAVSYENLESATRFNAGNQEGDAYTLSPYLLIVLNETFSLDFNAGIGRNKVSQNRVDPASAGTLSSSFDGTRYFVSGTVNGSRTIGNFTFGGRGGYLHAVENQDAYTESGGPSARSVGKAHIKLGQVYAGVDLAYAFTRSVEAYTSVVLRHDVSRSDGSGAGGLPNSTSNAVPTDRTGYDATLGLRLFSARAVSGFAEYVKTLGRDQFRQHAINLLVRLEL